MYVPKRGDWVVFEPGYTREIGRVWRYDAEENACSVCYSHGCTAAMTSAAYLRPYDPARDADLEPDPRIGFHRFDDVCPEYDPKVCVGCREVAA